MRDFGVRLPILAAWILLGPAAFLFAAEPNPIEARLGPAPVTATPKGPPDAWCPSGAELDEYFEARRKLPARRAELARRAQAPPPVVTSPNGVLLIEDSGTILRNDRVFDLPPESIELIPSGDGYEVVALPAAYESPGGALFSGATAWRAAPVTLTQFAFPFGGTPRTQFWVTPSNLIAFEPPTEPVKVGLCSFGCYYAEGHVLHDRLPRISPLQHGSFFYGESAFVQEYADRVVVTWQYGDPAALDVQAVLFADGRIRFNYNAVAGGIEWGAPVVVTGNDAFWSDLRLGGDVTDAAGDVTIPAPDGPAMNFLGASARQVGTSELLQLEFTLAAQPPQFTEEERIYWQIDIRDEAEDPEPLGSVLLLWSKGLYYWMTEPAVQDGTTLRLNLRLNELLVGDGDLHLTFDSFRGSGPPYEQGDTMQLLVSFAPPAERMMLDLSADLPVTLGDRPIYEAFTLPDLQTGEVLEVAAPLFEDPSTVEAFAIYQNHQTDLFFFGGGYHAGGNSGADGVGFGSSAAPRSPSLLHVNNIYGYGPEDWAMTVLNHEFGHRWLYHFAIDQGAGPTRILNPAGSHPAGWVYTPAVRWVYHPQDYSVMGGSNWVDNLDGTFSSPVATDGGPNGYTWHELYLMGLADPAEVTDWWYIDNPVPALPNAYWAPNGVTVGGTRVPVDIDQLIAVEGPRFPAYPDSLQSFLTPVVLVVRNGVYTQEEIDTIDYVCTLWRDRFKTATNGRGNLRCRFHQPAVAITSPATSINVFAGDTVNFAGAAVDDDGDAVALLWSFSGAVPDTTGAGPHPVIFTTTGVYPVRLSGVDASGMFAVQDQTVTITVDCPTTPPSVAVDGLMLAREAGEIRFTWTDPAVPLADYVVLGSTSSQGLFFPEGNAASGAPGLLLPEPGGTMYYEVAARSAEGCLGPY